MKIKRNQLVSQKEDLLKTVSKSIVSLENRMEKIRDRAQEIAEDWDGHSPSCTGEPACLLCEILHLTYEDIDE